jgi:hypothetical protein
MKHYFTLGYRFQDKCFAFYGECTNEMTVEETDLRRRANIAVVGIDFDLMLHLTNPDKDNVRPTKASISNQPYLDSIEGGNTYFYYLNRYLNDDNDFVISWAFESPSTLLFIYNDESGWSVEYQHDEPLFAMDGFLHEIVNIANTLSFKEGYEYIKTSRSGIQVMAEFLAPLM